VLGSLLENTQNWRCRARWLSCATAHAESAVARSPGAGRAAVESPPLPKGPSDAGLLWEQGAVRRASWSGSRKGTDVEIATGMAGGLVCRLTRALLF